MSFKIKPKFKPYKRSSRKANRVGRNQNSSNSMKTNLILLFFISTYLFVTSNLKAQCDCTELLRYGLYNHFSATSKVENYAYLKEAISTAETKANSVGASAGGSYGVYSGNFSYNQVKAMGKLASSENISEEEKNEFIETASSVISPEMMNAYRECLKLCDSNGNGLRIKADLPTDATADNISFSVSYKKPNFVGQTPIIKNVIITPSDCYACNKGSLYDKLQDKTPLKENQTYELICTRKISSTPFAKAGQPDFKIYSEAALIVIETTMGNYRVRIPPIYAQPILTSGIGDVVTSMLDKDAFTQLNGNGWALADGTDVPTGTKYHKYLKDRNLPTKLPDLRGMFLRGANNGRNDGKQNPENIGLGEPQADAIKPHKHKKGADATSPGGSEHHYWGGNISGEYEYSELNGETRPRNVTVNYFIRIN
jgi:hypothetical protein